MYASTICIGFPECAVFGLLVPYRIAEPFAVRRPSRSERNARRCQQCARVASVALRDANFQTARVDDVRSVRAPGRTVCRGYSRRPPRCRQRRARLYDWRRQRASARAPPPYPWEERRRLRWVRRHPPSSTSGGRQCRRQIGPKAAVAYA